MQHPHDDDPGPDDLKDGSIIAVQQMAISGAEQFVLRHERAAFGKAFQCADLFFHAQHKGGCRISLSWAMYSHISATSASAASVISTLNFFGTLKLFQKITCGTDPAAFHFPSVAPKSLQVSPPTVFFLDKRLKQPSLSSNVFSFMPVNLRLMIRSSSMLVLFSYMPSHYLLAYASICINYMHVKRITLSAALCNNASTMFIDVLIDLSVLVALFRYQVRDVPPPASCRAAAHFSTPPASPYPATAPHAAPA